MSQKCIWKLCIYDEEHISLTHWSYVYLALTHRYEIISLWPQWTGNGCLSTSLQVMACCLMVPGFFIGGLVQDCSNSIANALELLQSFTKPLIWTNAELLSTGLQELQSKVKHCQSRKCICKCCLLNIGHFIHMGDVSVLLQLHWWLSDPSGLPDLHRWTWRAYSPQPAHPQPGFTHGEPLWLWTPPSLIDLCNVTATVPAASQPCCKRPTTSGLFGDASRRPRRRPPISYILAATDASQTLVIMYHRSIAKLWGNGHWTVSTLKNISCASFLRGFIVFIAFPLWIVLISTIFISSQYHFCVHVLGHVGWWISLCRKSKKVMTAEPVWTPLTQDFFIFFF